MKIKTYTTCNNCPAIKNNECIAKEITKPVIFLHDVKWDNCMGSYSTIVLKNTVAPITMRVFNNVSYCQTVTSPLYKDVTDFIAADDFLLL